MKFVLDVEMGEDAFGGDAARESGRILRYWGGNLHYHDFKPGDGSDCYYDSAYTDVGGWRIVES
ncbi:hypothetical protein [Streptomonospora salina]|uniref:Uncharacterized protein n=1 Tax=Streptomonospora salina TaxID=104205 RepID=A0A841E2K2_9ACTN|nr:hypothetical protein [Streptomonospora salina]MBB5997256.1 hypothetical protein [Streptomonospora salina]